MMVFVKSLFSFELTFAAFLIVARRFGAERISWLPIDLTSVLLFMSVLFGVFTLVKHRRIHINLILGLGLYALFASWASLSLAWAPFTTYGSEKALRILLIGGWAFAGSALIVGRSPHRARLFFSVWIFLSVVIGTFAMLLYASGGRSALVENLGASYLGIARIIGLGLLVLFAYYITYSGKKNVTSLLYLIGIGFFSSVLLVIGARGPLLATFLSILLGTALVGRIPRLSWVAIAAAVFFAFSAFTLRLPPDTLYRLSVLIEDPSGGASAQGRLWRIQAALQQMAEAPFFGQGIGSFYYQFGEPSLGGDYPHNILLEVGAETGFVGLLLFSALLALSLHRLRLSEAKRNGALLASLMFFLNTLFYAMLSGDIGDNRLLFASLGLLLGLTSQPRVAGHQPSSPPRDRGAGGVRIYV